MLPLTHRVPVGAELTAAGPDSEIWQCLIVLQPVSSKDAITAEWTRLPYAVLAASATASPRRSRG